MWPYRSARVPALATVLSIGVAFYAATALAHTGHDRDAPKQAPAPAEAPALHADASHDHRDEAASDLPRPLAWLGKLHPASTHFPIALLIAASISEALFAATRTGLRIALAIGAILVTGAGFLGGSLVYGLDHLLW